MKKYIYAIVLTMEKVEEICEEVLAIIPKP